jgi:hypothetical protein
MALPLRNQFHHRWGKVRIRIHGHPLKRDGSGDGDKQHKHQHQKALPQRKLDQAINHDLLLE